MPANEIGQLIKFAMVTGVDKRFTGFRYEPVTKANNTISKIARKVGQDVNELKKLNGVRHADAPLKRKQVRVRDMLTEGTAFVVLAGDEPPRVTDGYPNITVVGRAERVGLSVFTGYNPSILEVPIRFESLDDEGSFRRSSSASPTLGSEGIEADIALLEKMAGRGAFPGAGQGPPPIIRVATTNERDEAIPLVPMNYQYDKEKNPYAPLYWIEGIDWDAGALRNEKGHRIRQLATVRLIQYVAPNLINSASVRVKSSQPVARSGKGKQDTKRPNRASGVGKI